MAYSYVKQEYDGTNNTITLPFEYISKSDVYLYINDILVDSSNFVWVTDYTITVTMTLDIGDVITVKRISELSSPIVDYQSGTILTEANLDISNIQHLYHTQELIDYIDELDVPTSVHNHDERYFTKNEIDTKLSTISAEGHNHDDLYYREFEINAILNSYYYTSDEVDVLLDNVSPGSHTHTKDDITDLHIYDGSNSPDAYSVIALDDGAVLPAMNAGALTNLTPTNITGIDPVTGSETVFLNEKGTFTQVEGEANVNADWDSTSGDSQILNRPYVYDGSGTLEAGDLIAANSLGEFPALDGKNITNLGIANLDNIDTSSGDTNKLLNEKGTFTDLSGITGGEINVQSDWTETDTNSDTYIQNKPTIPSTLVLKDETTLSGYLDNTGAYSIPDLSDTHYTETEIDTMLLDYYTETETDALLSNKADTVHTHHDLYYTEAESDSRYVQNLSDLSITATYTEINTVAAGPTAKNLHTHTLADVGLTSTASNINLVSSSITAKNSHIHDDRYYTESEVDALLSGVSWSHPIITGASIEVIDNSNTEVIQDLTSDEFGHITNIGTKILTLSDFAVVATASELNTVASGSTAKNLHTHDTRYYTESECDSLFVKTLSDLAISVTASEINEVVENTWGNTSGTTYLKAQDISDSDWKKRTYTNFYTPGSAVNAKIQDYRDPTGVNLEATFKVDVFKKAGGTHEDVGMAGTAFKMFPSYSENGYDLALAAITSFPDAIDNGSTYSGGKMGGGSTHIPNTCAAWIWMNGPRTGQTDAKGHSIFAMEVNIQENDCDSGYREFRHEVPTTSSIYNSFTTNNRYKYSIGMQVVPESGKFYNGDPNFQPAYNTSFGYVVTSYNLYSYVPSMFTSAEVQARDPQGKLRQYVGFATLEDAIVHGPKGFGTGAGGVGFLSRGGEYAQANASTYDRPWAGFKVSEYWGVGIDLEDGHYACQRDGNNLVNPAIQVGNNRIYFQNNGFYLDDNGNAWVYISATDTYKQLAFV